MSTPIDVLYSLYQQCNHVVIDSRNVSPNDLFFALKGEHADGNVYARKALDAGALAAVVDDVALRDVQGCVYVLDVLSTLQQLAEKHRSSFSFPVLGLTGSNGKTTTKELIFSVLQSSFKVKATKGNLNNHIGVPLTLLSVREPLDYLIVEMGANHQGEIEFLCSISKPDFGLITNIGKAHLEGFGGVEGVKKGKSELYRFIQSSQGKLFVNGDDEVLISLLPSLTIEQIIKYYPKDYTSEITGTHVHFKYQNKMYITQLTGEYNLANLAAAICVGEYFGIEPDSIASALTKYSPDNNRSESREYKGLHLILDAYNANPTSMRASIENFINLDVKDKVLVLGDMFELGEYSYTEHAQLTQWIASFPWKHVLFIGKQFSACKLQQKNFAYFENVEEAKVFFQSFYHTNVHVLLKGSRGIALEKILV